MQHWWEASHQLPQGNRFLPVQSEADFTLFRHWNMMDETWLINIIKERLCYISLDFLRDLEITRLRGAENRIKREYVLPDYVTNHTGFIKVCHMEPCVVYVVP